ncbi:hypothetical protein, partial [Methylobacterium crusticola]|uniref:hypothetical protein n=1 Tax=Methylobacterium crusticola TaxID=1697972 RepID=UPI001EE38F15
GVSAIGGNILFDLSLLTDQQGLSVIAEAVDLRDISSDCNISEFGGALNQIVASGGANEVLEQLSELQPGDVDGFERILGGLV